MLKEGRSVSALGTPYQLPALSFDFVRRGCPKAGARIGVKGTVVRPSEVSRDTQGPKARDQGFIDRAVAGPGGSQTVFAPARRDHNRIRKLSVVQDLAPPCGAADRVDPPSLKGKCVIPMKCALIPTERKGRATPAVNPKDRFARAAALSECFINRHVPRPKCGGRLEDSPCKRRALGAGVSEPQGRGSVPGEAPRPVRGRPQGYGTRLCLGAEARTYRSALG